MTNTMRKITIATFAVLCFALAGCSHPAEKVQSVAWFKAHTTDRTAVLKKCRAMSAEAYMHSENCSRSKEAQRLVDAGKHSGVKVDFTKGMGLPKAPKKVTTPSK